MWALLPLSWRIAGIAGGLALVASIYGVWHHKVAADAARDTLVKVEKEKQDAIAKAQAARERLRLLCVVRPLDCVPDDWLRD